MIVKKLHATEGNERNLTLQLNLFMGHPRDQGKCPLNGGWAGKC